MPGCWSLHGGNHLIGTDDLTHGGLTFPCIKTGKWEQIHSQIMDFVSPLLHWEFSAAGPSQPQHSNGKTEHPCPAWSARSQEPGKNKGSNMGYAVSFWTCVTRPCSQHRPLPQSAWGQRSASEPDFLSVKWALAGPTS